MWAAKTDPDEAVSNIFKWLRHIGFTPPSWIQEGRVDLHAKVLGRTLFFGGIALLFVPAVWPHWPEEQSVKSILSLPPIPKTDTAHEGILKPANHPTPESGCDHMLLPETATKIIFGSSGTAITGFRKMTVLKIDDCEALAVERTPDGIFLNAEVNDGSGVPPAKIVNNRIIAYDGEYYSSKQSADSSLIVVKNTSGDVLLEANFLNQNAIKINGVFGCAGKKSIIVKDNEPVPGFIMRNSCFANPSVAFSVHMR